MCSLGVANHLQASGDCTISLGRERNRKHSCDQVCDLTALQLVSHWVSFEYQASWQRRVSPPSILGLFLTICARSFTGLFTVNCLVLLPSSSCLLLAPCIAMRSSKHFFLECKWHKLGEAILLARPKKSCGAIG